VVQRRIYDDYHLEIQDHGQKTGLLTLKLLRLRGSWVLNLRRTIRILFLATTLRHMMLCCAFKPKLIAEDKNALQTEYLKTAEEMSQLIIWRMR